MDLTKKIKRNAKSSFQIADGKAVVMLAANSHIFTLNEIGTLIWGMLDTPKTFDELVTGAQKKFPDDSQNTIRQDILAFITECLTEQLLIQGE